MISRRITSYLSTGIFILLLLTACRNNPDVKSTVQVEGTTKDTAAVAALLKRSATYNQTNIDSMRYYAGRALEMATAIQFKEGIAKAMNMECTYQRKKGNYAGAIAIGLQVVTMFDSLHLWKEQVRMKNYIADIYKEMGGEKGTVEYLRKGLGLSKQGQAIAEQRNYPAGVVISLNQQGIIQRDLSGAEKRPDLMDSAFVLYKKGISIIEKTGEGEDNLGKFYNNIAQVYNEHFKNYPQAIAFLNKAIAFNTKRNNKTSLTYNYDALSYVYQAMDNFDSANFYGHKMLALSKDLKTPYRMVNAYLVLTNANKRINHHDSSLYYYEQSVSLADSLNNIEKAGQIAEMQTKYETDKKEEEIGLLNKMNTVKSQRLWLVGGIAILFGLLIVMSFIQNRRLQKQKVQISAQSDRLQWLMKELHHRVKNNLQIVSSLLNLQSYRLKDDDSITALRESQLRVQAMSLIHQRLYQVEDVSVVNFKLYLDDLVETLMRSYGYGADEFDLLIKVDKEYLDVDTVMPMGLLVNEIITNSFKYAYKEVKRPLLHISLSSGDRQLELEIKDNGPGLNGESKQGFGKKLIEALSKQLRANYSIDSSHGTAYHFTIPHDKEKAA